MSQNVHTLYSWDFEDSKNRSPLWYMIALAIAIGLIIWGFLTSQYGMSIVIMLTVGIFFFLENNSEEHVHVDITDLGIRIQDVFYDYSRIASYSIIYDGDKAVFLRLHLKKRSVTFANLGIDNSVATSVRPIISQFIEESEKGEVTFLEKITHLLKL